MDRSREMLCQRKGWNRVMEKNLINFFMESKWKRERGTEIDLTLRWWPAGGTETLFASSIGDSSIVSGASNQQGFATLLTENWTRKIRETSSMKRNSICALSICLLVVIFALGWCYRINQITHCMIVVYLAILFDPCRSLCDKLKCNQRSEHGLHDAQHHAYIITCSESSLLSVASVMLDLLPAAGFFGRSSPEQCEVASLPASTIISISRGHTLDKWSPTDQ